MLNALCPTILAFREPLIRIVFLTLSSSSPVSYTHLGQTRIVIYMPATADTHFTDFDLGDYHPVQAPARKYLALGCSITQGMEAVSPSITYTNIVKRHYNAQILNLGIGGFYYDPDSLDEELSYDPDIILSLIHI